MNKGMKKMSEMTANFKMIKLFKLKNEICD